MLGQWSERSNSRCVIIKWLFMCLDHFIGPCNFTLSTLINRVPCGKTAELVSFSKNRIGSIKLTHKMAPLMIDGQMEYNFLIEKQSSWSDSQMHPKSMNRANGIEDDRQVAPPSQPPIGAESRTEASKRAEVCLDVRIWIIGNVVC